MKTTHLLPFRFFRMTHWRRPKRLKAPRLIYHSRFFWRKRYTRKTFNSNSFHLQHKLSTRRKNGLRIRNQHWEILSLMPQSFLLWITKINSFLRWTENGTKVLKLRSALNINWRAQYRLILESLENVHAHTHLVMKVMMRNPLMNCNYIAMQYQQYLCKLFILPPLVK